VGSKRAGFVLISKTDTVSVLESGDCAARGQHFPKNGKMSFLEKRAWQQFVAVGVTVTGTTTN